MKKLTKRLKTSINCGRVYLCLHHSLVGVKQRRRFLHQERRFRCFHRKFAAVIGPNFNDLIIFRSERGLHHLRHRFGLFGSFSPFCLGAKILRVRVCAPIALWIVRWLNKQKSLSEKSLFDIISVWMRGSERVGEELRHFRLDSKRFGLQRQPGKWSHQKRVSLQVVRLAQMCQLLQSGELSVTRSLKVNKLVALIVDSVLTINSLTLFDSQRLSFIWFRDCLSIWRKSILRSFFRGLWISERFVSDL